MIERRAGLNFRVQGRTVSGTALRYGDVADMGRFREMFVSGAFSPIGEVALNLQHDSARVLAKTGNGLVLADGPRSLEVRAELTGKAEHELVRRGALRGFSIEFVAKSQRYEGGTRVIESAELTGLALVDDPAYPGSLAEARARSGRSLRQRIPANRKLGCQCSGATCKFAKFTQEALSEAFTEAWNEAVEILAVRSSYGTPLASKSRGSVRATMDGDDAVVEVDLPDGDAGAAVLADIENTGAVLIRPYLDSAESEGVIEAARAENAGNTMVYSRMRVRSLVVGATDEVTNWPAPELVRTPEEMMPEGRAAPAPRREVRWWLL